MSYLRFDLFLTEESSFKIGSWLGSTGHFKYFQSTLLNCKFGMLHLVSYVYNDQNKMPNLKSSQNQSVPLI